MHVSLIVPAPFDTISGGYGYDRRMVLELRAAGHEVEVFELSGTFPMADDPARTAGRQAMERLPPGTVALIDGLALPAFDALADAIVACGAVGLIHHPLSLETGLAEADRSLLASIEHRMLPRLSRLIVTSDTTAETLVSRFHIPPQRVHTVVPGTDDAPRCHGSGGPTRRILSIGTLVPRKGHDVLLRALAMLSDLDWHLTIVGSPDREPLHARALTALANELGIAPRVSFAGELVGEALESAWRSADIFALATWYEGYGMAIAEALKRGLPVLTTDGGAAGALISPGAGYVCPAGDVDRLSIMARRLIADRAGRRRMSERAWQTGQTLPSWRAQAMRLITALA